MKDSETEDRSPAQGIGAIDVLMTVGVGSLLGVALALGLYVGPKHRWAYYVGGVLGLACILFMCPVCNQMRRHNRQAGVWTRGQTMLLTIVQWGSTFLIGFLIIIIFRLCRT